MEKILLLHGAIGSAEQFDKLIDALEGYFELITFNFSGHGGKAYYNSAFSIAGFADEVIQFLNEKSIDNISIFGYSMGGYVGMYLAKNHPEKIKQLVTLATKFYWDEKVAEKEISMLNSDVIQQKVPAFAAILDKRHQPNNWIDVLDRTKTMLKGMGANNPLKLDDYVSVTTPVLVLIGDRDKMITLEETVNVYKALPNAQMGMLTNCQHPLEQTNIDQLAYHLKSFFI